MVVALGMDEPQAIGLFPERVQGVVQRYGAWVVVLAVVALAAGALVLSTSAIDVVLSLEFLIPLTGASLPPCWRASRTPIVDTQ